MMNYLNLYVIKIFSLLFLLNAISASARIDEVFQVVNNFIEVKQKNVSINDYIEGTNEAREIIDLRNTTITEHVIDFGNKNEYINCTPLQSCRFQCSYIKLNLIILN